VKGGAEVVGKEGSNVDCTLGNGEAGVRAGLLSPLSGAGARTRNDGVGMVSGATLSAGSAGAVIATLRDGRRGGGLPIGVVGCDKEVEAVG
jgi:hypothetical protein